VFYGKMKKRIVGYCVTLSSKISSKQLPDEPLFALLKDLSPPAIDLELRLLITSQQQISFLNALKGRLLSHKDFEMVQTLIAVFLRLHGEQLIENEEILEYLQELLVVTKIESDRLDILVTRSMGMLGFIRDL
jgi:U3 small nucleolar RNA-associated protein 21